MKKLTLLVTLTALTCISAFAQVADKSAVVRLKGKATQKVLPDIAVVYFSVNARDKAEAETLNKLNTQTQAIITRMLTLGFSKEELKLTSYQINEDYVYGEKPKKVGYVASNTLVLRFKFDKEKLANLFSKIMQERTENVNINFGTEISKELQKKVSDQLVKDAIKDAGDKVKMIAQMADLRISGIKEIRYNIQDNYMVPMARGEAKMVMGMADAAAAPPVFANLDVEEVELFEEVEVSYSMENIR
jgi:uncharacterized protein YggE